jgi:uracil-DNA glycosylase
MIALEALADFDGWRDQAKQLWHAQTPPEMVGWGEASLFGDAVSNKNASAPETRVPAGFVTLAQTVFMHNDPSRLDLLYRLFWRLQSNRRLLDDATDPDVVKAGLLAKAVRRDIQKMRAFIRFKEMAEEDGEAHYVAWFEPDHTIVHANAGFFVRRFASMRWSILTPQLCLYWDGETLHESPGIAKPANLHDDPVEDLWRSYYASIFNPARLKTKAMLKEMPRRYWKNMPEAELIPGLIAGAQAREAAMIAIGAAPDELPPPDWDSLHDSIDLCTRCPLYCDATQAVHGQGPHDARLMIVGEQPGDKEDLAGRPFVGPAGLVLNEGLAAAGIDRDGAWLTNAVKHFKHERRGKLRLHQSPNAGEIDHCRWWLDAERKLVQPQLILALGASAIRGVIGKTGSVASYRGRAVDLGDGSTMVATTHPSYILRVGDTGREKAMAEFVEDLQVVARMLG